MDYTSPDHSRFFPDKGAPENEILAYRDRLMNRWSIIRNEHMGRIAMSIWYYLGKQWIEFDPDSVFDGVRGSILRQIRADDGPRPVTNIISPAVEEEVIALVKRGWQPKIVASSNDPRMKAAAQVAHDSLNYRLKLLSWPEKRAQLGLNFVVSGTGLIYTGHDRSYEDLRVVGSPTAMQCPACQTTLSNPNVPIGTLQLGMKQQAGGYAPVQHLENARPVEMDPESAATYSDPASMQEATLNYCPTCEAPTPLQPYTPTEDEMDSADAFDRPLGVLEPRGGSTIEIDLPHEFYPQDAGVHITPDTLRRWGRRKIRSMEWWEAHAPHLVHEIAPDPVAELLYDDPLLGSWSTLGNWNPSYDQGVLDNHANADELVEQPSFRHPLGRYVLCSKDVVVVDDDLYQIGHVEDSPDPVYVPRANESASRYKIRPTQFWGTTQPEQIISPQNRLNGMDRQIIDERDRLGGITVMMTPGMWASDPVAVEGGFGAARVLFFQPDPANPDLKAPTEYGGKLFPETVYMERDRVLTDAKNIVGSSEAATGNNPTGVGNTSQLQLLLEQDEKSRSLREDALITSVEKSWTHLNEMQWILQVDTEDIYRVLGPDKTWAYEQYTGNALRGQTEVEIERAAYIEKSVMRRESAREALADGLVTITSPLDRQRMLENYGLDINVNEDVSNQVEQAEKQWVDFHDKQIVRVMDSIDDPQIRYLVFGTHLLTEEGQKLTAAAGWDEIARQIAGWEDELQRINMLEAMSIQFYGGRLVGQEAADAYAKAEIAYQDSNAQFKQQQATNAQLQQESAAAPPEAAAATAGTPPPIAPVPPTPPPPPVDIPVLLQARIELVWSGMLEKRGVKIDRNPVEEIAAASGTPPPIDAGLGPTPTVDAPPDPRPSYVKFRALVEAYRLSMTSPATPGTGASAIPVDKGGPAMPPPGPGPAAGPAGPGAQPPPPNPTAPMPEGGAH